eukprot:TRINITY_DN68117_c0_g1_i1.p1 TRINITY_DN68117_c0_g1~~TRINITY_DN68117_c0_g1_i1.p1  ORF type:complete len:399 (+),score=59.83 TRINITY_DN68117_c0_g1_i1:42-1238(+)
MSAFFGRRVAPLSAAAASALTATAAGLSGGRFSRDTQEFCHEDVSGNTRHRAGLVFNLRGSGASKSRWRRALSKTSQQSSVSCATSSAASTPVTASTGCYVERLRAETQMLLSRRLGEASAACPPEEALSRMSTPELISLFLAVKELVGEVDRITGDEPILESKSSVEPEGALVRPVRNAYGAFLVALSDVERAILGPGARPFVDTHWWVPLLLRWRYHVNSFYSWGLLPEVVVKEAGDLLQNMGVLGVLDPLAGSGWHARLWRDVGGLEACALDYYSVRPVDWASVKVVADSREELTSSIDISGPGGIDRWALYLSWPPHSPETVGVEILRRWPGQWLIYLGERMVERDGCNDEGVTGGVEFLAELESKWEPVRSWTIPRWPGYGDDMTIYRRQRRE